VTKRLLEMNRSTINKLLLARRLYQLAFENIGSDNELSLCIGVNLLQDSVESFLLAVSEHVNAGVSASTKFDKYFELIDKKISPKELPFRLNLLGLNKLRVNSKHYGLVPAKSELEGLAVAVREFFAEASISILGKNFNTISLLDLVREGEAKDCLAAAQRAFESRNFTKCLIEGRKALFIRFESSYDISPFAIDKPRTGLEVFFLGTKAPHYARRKEYIDEQVSDPTDYIVYDYNQLEMELMKLGIDNLSYWNVWRLTPAVYRKHKGEEWIVKMEFHKLDEDGIEQRAEYVLDTIINLFVTVDQKSSGSRSANRGAYFVNLKRDKIPIYQKADKRSKVAGETPQGSRRVLADYTVTGFDQKSLFLHVSGSEDGGFLSGYIDNDEVEQ